MTSELKPCPFCGAKAKFKGGRLSQDSVTIWCENLHRSGGFATKEAAAADWNTRAVPDVPELVRYERTVAYEQQEHLGMVEHRYGDYVLHSQAAEIIAADRAEKHRAQEAVLKLERELAQYKDQIPIGYITPKAQLSLLQEFSASDSISPVKMGECRVAIYDRPAPAADLKAENEKLREALTKISSPTQTAGLLWWQVEARAALNVEASNDKG